MENVFVPFEVKIHQHYEASCQNYFPGILEAPASAGDEWRPLLLSMEACEQNTNLQQTSTPFHLAGDFLSRYHNTLIGKRIVINIL